MAATSRVSADAGELAPRDLALGEGRQRDVDEQHGAVAERERVARARAAQEHDRRSALVDRRSRRARSGGSRPVEAVEAQQAVLERGGERRRPPSPRRARVAATSKTSSAAGGGGHDRGRVRPADDSGSAVSAPSRRATSLDDLVRPATGGRGSTPPQRRGRAGLGEAAAGAEQERGEPVGDLDRPVGERDRAVGLRAAAARRRARAGAEAPKQASTSARSTPSPASRSATSRGLASRRVTSSCR